MTQATPGQDDAKSNFAGDDETFRRLIVAAAGRNVAHRRRWWLIMFAFSTAIFATCVVPAWWIFRHRPAEFGLLFPLAGAVLDVGFGLLLAMGYGFLIRKWLVSWLLHRGHLRSAVRRTAIVARQAREFSKLSSDPSAQLYYYLIFSLAAILFLISAAHLLQSIFAVPAAAITHSFALPTALLILHFGAQICSGYTLAYRPPDVLYLSPSTRECVLNFIRLSWALYDPRAVTLIESRVWEAARANTYLRTMIDADAFRTDQSADWQGVVADLSELCSLIIIDTRAVTQPLLHEIGEVVSKGRLSKTLFVIPETMPAALLELAVAQCLLYETNVVMAVREGGMIDAALSIYSDRGFSRNGRAGLDHRVSDVLAWGPTALSPKPHTAPCSPRSADTAQAAKPPSPPPP